MTSQRERRQMRGRSHSMMYQLKSHRLQEVDQGREATGTDQEKGIDQDQERLGTQNEEDQGVIQDQAKESNHSGRKDRSHGDQDQEVRQNHDQGKDQEPDQDQGLGDKEGVDQGGGIDQEVDQGTDREEINQGAGPEGGGIDQEGVGVDQRVDQGILALIVQKRRKRIHMHHILYQ